MYWGGAPLGGEAWWFAVIDGQIRSHPAALAEIGEMAVVVVGHLASAWLYSVGWVED